MSVKIDLRQVRAITVKLLDNLIESEGVEEVELKADYYWDMSPDIMFDVSEKPKELDMGSLHDEWEFLRIMLDEDNEAVTYELTELAPLLRYIGEVYGGSFSGEGRLPKPESE